MATWKFFMPRQSKQGPRKENRIVLECESRIIKKLKKFFNSINIVQMFVRMLYQE